MGQGVQQNDEDAAKVVAKAIGGGQLDRLENSKPVRVEDMKQTVGKRRKRRSSSEGSCNVSEGAGSREGSPDGSKTFAWESPDRGKPVEKAPAAGSPSPRSKRLGRTSTAAPSARAQSPSPRSKRLGRVSQQPPPTANGDNGGDVVVDFF